MTPPSPGGRTRRGPSGLPARRAWAAAFLLSAGLSACKGDATPAWAVQHASLEVLSAGVEGYQVWELFDKGWDRNQDEKHHVCAIVQTVQGSLVSDLDGCLDCEASYELQVALLESDCAPGIAGSGTYGGVWGYAFGAIPATEADQDPHPGRSLGWYLSWDGAAAEFMGFAWPEDAGTGADAGAQGWEPGVRYTLEPVYAWEL